MRIGRGPCSLLIDADTHPSKGKVASLAMFHDIKGRAMQVASASSPLVYPPPLTTKWTIFLLLITRTVV